MGRSDKKTRADNFSEEDKGLLLTLIADHVSVLECRKTDHKNNSAKYKAWATISKNFHRQASHPRNFTQMKDLYRRLKLKAKKEVGMWLKACAESGTGKPLPSSQVIQPDDTSFWVYDLIKPFKEELNPEDEEQDRLLFEAIKERDLSETFSKPDEDDSFHDSQDDELDIEPPVKPEGDDEDADEEADDSPDVRVKEEPDFDYIPPGVVTAAAEKPSEVVEVGPEPRPERSCVKRASRERWSPPGAPSTFTDPRRAQKRSRLWDPTTKRRRVIPLAGPRLSSNGMPPGQTRYNSVFNRPNFWDNPNSTFNRKPVSVPNRHKDTNKEESAEGMSPYEDAMFQLAQAEHKAKMLVLQTQRRAETAKEEAYKMIWQNSQLQRDLLQLQYENVL